MHSPAIRSGLLGLLGLASCQSAWWHPPLEQEPWSMIEPGRVGVSLHPGLFTLYDIEGDFTAETPVSGTLMQSDAGDLVGKFGLGARTQVVLTDRLVLSGGAEYRVYDIEGLNPIQDLDVRVETVDSLQYFIALRYLFDPFESHPRLRPWCEASVAYLPSVDVGFEVDLSAFGSSNLNIDTEGEGYWVGGAAVGLLYQWTDNITTELGVVYEVPLSALDTDLSFTIGPTTVPMFGELEPEGIIGFGGVTWYL